MSAARDIETDYGGPFADAHAVTNPDTDQTAAQANRVMEDVAHLTRTACKARIRFTTRNSNGNCTLGAFVSQWTSTATTETIARTAAGEYTATIKTSYTDDLSAAETVALVDADVHVYSSNNADNLFARIKSISGNVVNFIIESPKGTLADYGNTSAAAVTGVIRVY